MNDQSSGPTEPDYRFTLANERTFLAWIRTSLALLAVAVAIVQFVPSLGSDVFRELCAIGFALFAVLSSAGGAWRWARNRRAMSYGEPLQPGILPASLSAGLAVIGVAVLVVLVGALLR